MSDPDGVEPWDKLPPVEFNPAGVEVARDRATPGALVPRDPGLFTFKPSGLGAGTGTPLGDWDASAKNLKNSHILSTRRLRM